MVQNRNQLIKPESNQIQEVERFFRVLCSA